MVQKVRVIATPETVGGRIRKSSKWMQASIENDKGDELIDEEQQEGLLDTSGIRDLPGALEIDRDPATGHHHPNAPRSSMLTGQQPRPPSSPSPVRSHGTSPKSSPKRHLEKPGWSLSAHRQKQVTTGLGEAKNVWSLKKALELPEEEEAIQALDPEGVLLLPGSHPDSHPSKHPPPDETHKGPTPPSTPP